MKDYVKKYPYILLAPFVFIAVLFFFIAKEPEEQEAADPSLFSTENSSSVKSTDSSIQDWYVDVKGAVNKAGMYRITQGMRLVDAIDLAGGFTKDADQNQLNFSKLLTDQEVIYVPKNGEEIPTMNETITSGNTHKINETETAKININTADANELQQLSGIGEKKAADIINYRETNGSFHAIEDLTKVSGIGEKTLEKLKDLITI